MALKKLRRMFKGTIENAKIRATTFKLDKNDVDQLSLKMFKQAIVTYNPSAGTKPSTHIYNAITMGLKKENDFASNRTLMKDQGHTTDSRYIYTAEQDLIADGIEPTPDRVAQLASTFKGGKPINNMFLVEGGDYVLKVKGLVRKDLSSGLSTSGDEGEQITFEDVYHADKASKQDLFDFNRRQQIQQVMSRVLTPLEQNVVKDREGLWEDGRAKETNWNYIVLNNPELRSRHLAQKVYNEAMEKLKNEL